MGYIRKFVSQVGVGLSKSSKGIVNTSTIQTINKLNEDSGHFNELEPFEVLNVCLTEKDLPTDESGNPNFDYYGSVLGRFIYSESNLSIDKCTFFRPLSPDFTRTPVIGEILYGFDDEGDRYFLGTLHVKNSVVNRAQPNLSTPDAVDTNNTKGDTTYKVSPNQGKYNPGYYYFPLPQVKPLKTFEGDTIIQGRFGNSIRLGSNQVNDQVGSTNIKITSGLTGFTNEGKLSIENIKSDLNSIHLTYNEKQNFDLPIESIRIQDVKDYDKAQVQIRSDRLIFTTKKSDGNSIGIFSGDKISIGSVNDVYVESPLVVIESSEVKVGSENAEEPQVLGQTLYDKLEALVTAIGGVTGIPTPTGPTPGPVSAAPNWSSVTSALSAVKDALSEKHRIDK
tara:strand:+ start:151 stop:1332 length:1182 start_codon:yes stop_codon:yes gene_type:complete